MCSELHAGNEHIVGDDVHAQDMLFRMMENGRRLQRRSFQSHLTLACRGQHNSDPPAATEAFTPFGEVPVSPFAPPFLPHHLWPSFSNDHLSSAVWQQGRRNKKCLLTFWTGLALPRSQSSCGWKGCLFLLMCGSSLPWCSRTISCLSWSESFPCPVWAPTTKTWGDIWNPKTFIQASILD